MRQEVYASFNSTYDSTSLFFLSFFSLFFLSFFSLFYFIFFVINLILFESQLLLISLAANGIKKLLEKIHPGSTQIKILILPPELPHEELSQLAKIHWNIVIDMDENSLNKGAHKCMQQNIIRSHKTISLTTPSNIASMFFHAQFLFISR